jgi:peptidoglycan/LPS O-acetylase OafA/YrhL
MEESELDLPSKQTLPPLDGLRATAILLVLWCHLSLAVYSFHLVGTSFLLSLGAFGFTGVFLFFVLSGFLLFLPYARALLGDASWPSVRRFYQRRAMRILPVYLVALTVLGYVYVSIGRAQVTPQTLVLLPLLLFNMSPTATNLAAVLNPPFWTLAIEWQYYLLLPWIALGLAKLVGGRTGRSLWIRIGFGLGLLIMSGLLLRAAAAVVFYTSGQDNPAAAPGLLGIIMAICFGANSRELDVFALGMAASLFYVWAIEQGHLSIHRQRLVGLGAFIFFVLGLAASFWWASVVGRVSIGVPTNFSYGQAWAVFGEWTIGVCFMLLLLAVVFGSPGLGWIFSQAPLRYIGIISYSLYAWHWPLLVVCFTILAVPASGVLERVLLVSCAVVFLVGSGSYFAIERPFLRWRHSVKKSVATQLPALQ